MKRKRNHKMVTFETSTEIWSAIKIAACRDNKTIKEYLNDVFSKMLLSKEVKDEAPVQQ